MVAPELYSPWVLETQEEINGNPGNLGPMSPHLADQDLTLERGEPMKAGPFLAELDKTPGTLTRDPQDHCMFQRETGKRGFSLFCPPTPI